MSRFREFEFMPMMPGRVLPISTGHLEGISGQNISHLLWFPINSLWIRSDRLRPAGEPSKISTLENPRG
jgi:hypothetical protein